MNHKTTAGTPGEPEAPREIVTTRIFRFPREKVFRAWAEPEHLAAWWGPDGFSNTFEEFDFRIGGFWRFVMHGPDGADYRNESRFVEIQEGELIVFEHLSDHWFHATFIFEDAGGGDTRLTFRQLFETVADCAPIREFVTMANEQNFDRLEAELGRMG